MKVVRERRCLRFNVMPGSDSISESSSLDEPVSTNEIKVFVSLEQHDVSIDSHFPLFFFTTFLFAALRLAGMAEDQVGGLPRPERTQIYG